MKTPSKKVFKKIKTDLPVKEVVPVVESKVGNLSYEEAAIKIKSNSKLLASFKAKKASTPKGKEFTMVIAGQTFKYKGIGDEEIELKQSKK